MTKSGFIRNYQQRKNKNFETTLSRLISLLLVTLFISVILLYYSSIKVMDIEQMEKSNSAMTEQVAISFETIMKQITDSIYKIPLYDTELLQFIRSYKQSSLYKIEIYKRLDSIVLGNDYLFSSYLYLPARNQIFSSESGNSYSIDSFPDNTAIAASRKEKISVMDPRLVDTSLGKKLLISVVSPLPLTSGDYEGVLVVNINANQLYYDILKKIRMDDSMNFFVYNMDNTIIIHKDESLLFKKIAPENILQGKKDNNLFSLNLFNKKRVLTSSYYSKTLNWNFVLETTVKSTPNFMTKAYTFIIYLIILLILSQFIMILVVKHSTKPLNKTISNYNEKLWRDLLVDNVVDQQELQRQLKLDIFSINGGICATVLLQILKPDMQKENFHNLIDLLNAFTSSLKKGYNVKLIVPNKEQVAFLLYFKDANSVDEITQESTIFAQLILGKLPDDIRSHAFISISHPNENIYMLPMLYRQCIEALNYKMASSSHILQYTDIKERELTFQYPLDLEKQMINNLIVGNKESCVLFLERFFNKLLEQDISLNDSEIKNYIYQLQTSILRSISGLPIPVKIDTPMNILTLFNLDDIRISMLDFIEKILTDINKKGKNDELNLINAVLEYIEKNYTREDFNLNSIANDLSLNRNYLTTLIKERYNDNFNDYINKKRVALGKQLLKETNLTIESISHQVGFNYAHYFIKVFKGIEAITPGQYREINL